ncbi:Ninjurin-1 [Portunus trituberculatus]|uniref:Ninjurin-1 n=1 Tax=Portunus trituberculatus TaxID=210409 RepID=A0A5B7HDX1_PORTR|nr:Ninjurin-1 [Portunus trituberculatus]
MHENNITTPRYVRGHNNIKIIFPTFQVSAGVVLILAERFDINKEEDQEHGDWMNTLVTCIIFIVLIINVFVASLGVDVADPFQPPSYPGLASSTTLSPLDVFKGPNYG